jgi:hypothetical protein
MSTELLDQIIQMRRDRQERDRHLTLQKVHQWLNEHASNYGIHRAFIFGSVTRPRHFHDRSDVDVAVEQINPDTFFQAMADLSDWVERDVDLIELEKCPFQDRIRETGIEWIMPPSSSLSQT